MARFSLPDCRWSLFMSVPRRSFSLLFSVSVRPCSVTRPSVFHLLRLISRRASPEPRPSARPAVCSFARPGAQSDIKFYYPCYRSAHSPPLIRAPRSPPLPAGLPLALSHFHPAGIHRPSCLARSNLRLRAPARLFCVSMFRCGAAICFTDRPLSGAQARIAPAWFPLSPASLSFPLVPSSECFRTLVTLVCCYICRPVRFSTPPLFCLPSIVSFFRFPAPRPTQSRPLRLVSGHASGAQPCTAQRALKGAHCFCVSLRPQRRWSGQRFLCTLRSSVRVPNQGKRPPACPGSLTCSNFSLLPAPKLACQLFTCFPGLVLFLFSFSKKAATKASFGFLAPVGARPHHLHRRQAANFVVC